MKWVFSKKIFLAIALGTAVFFLAIFLAVFSVLNVSQFSKNNFQNAEIEPPKLTELELQRPNYGFSPAVFEELPKPPPDFLKVAELLHNGKYSNYSFFSQNYFLQPEFFPSFKENAFSYWLKPDADYYAATGFGFYPASQQIQIMAGESKTASFFMHAGWGVQSIQGVRIEFKNEADGIKLAILEPEFLLTHSFPKFSKNWAKKVDAKISVEKNVVPGTYEIIFFPVNPSEQNRSKWRALYARPYFDVQSSGADLSAKILVKVI